VLWVGLGVTELLVHDVGNERRFVFLIPALAALTAIAMGRDRVLVPPALVNTTRIRALWALPLVLYVVYIIWGTIVRMAFLYEVGPAVRLSAILAAITTLIVYATWPRLPRWLSEPASPRGATVLAALVVAGGVAQFTQYAAGRTYKNVEASRALGRILPPGTLVHGKLANGLALENGIHPVFVGREFGNYADRLTRNDVPFILTYVVPRVGYEGPVIREVVDAYPRRRILWTFDVSETPGGLDRAALIEKGPPAIPGIARLPQSDVAVTRP
jgi:hypothetical protein